MGHRYKPRENIALPDYSGKTKTVTVPERKERAVVKMVSVSVMVLSVCLLLMYTERTYHCK